MQWRFISTGGWDRRSRDGGMSPEDRLLMKATGARYGDLVDGVQDRSLDMLPYTPAPSRVP